MKLTITAKYLPEGRALFWKLYDGPDGIDERDGIALTLDEALEAVKHQRELIARQYA